LDNSKQLANKEGRMKKFIVLLAMVLFVYYSPCVFAAEHGGQEHGGQEHGGAAVAAQPSAKDIKSTMKNYVEEKSKQTGTFDIIDPETGKMRSLKLQRIHERVGKTGDYFYSCADFKDTKSGEMLDLDIDVKNEGGKLSVVDVRIHKINGKPRYTYDKNDNRIPVKK
jgi:hypothetical protein